MLLVHPGGPFFKNKDNGWWTIPKGIPEPGEDMLNAAIREFFEETGKRLSGEFVPLQRVKQRGGKIVYAWAIEGDLDVESVSCNAFKMEWPPRSGVFCDFPEIDMARWFELEEARQKINSGQVPLLAELQLMFLNKHKKA